MTHEIAPNPSYHDPLLKFPKREMWELTSKYYALKSYDATVDVVKRHSAPITHHQFGCCSVPALGAELCTPPPRDPASQSPPCSYPELRPRASPGFVHAETQAAKLPKKDTGEVLCVGCCLQMT